MPELNRLRRLIEALVELTDRLRALIRLCLRAHVYHPWFAISQLQTFIPSISHPLWSSFSANFASEHFKHFPSNSKLNLISPNFCSDFFGDIYCESTFSLTFGPCWTAVRPFVLRVAAEQRHRSCFSAFFRVWRGNHLLAERGTFSKYYKE